MFDRHAKKTTREKSGGEKELSDIFDRIEARESELDRMADKLADSDVFDILVSAHRRRDVRPLRTLIAMVAQECPLPMWIKNHEGRMVWQNDAYREQFCSYVGERDVDAYDEQTASGFDENDQTVAKNKTFVFCAEKINHPTENRSLILQVVKWPVMVGNDAAVCVCGIGLGSFPLTD